MKKVIVLFAAVLLAASISAQSPGKISYQAVIRDNSGALIPNQTVAIQISILRGSADGLAVYTESQTPVTNANGLVILEIGIQPGFDDIDWANGPYFIKTETDLNGGNNYTITGTSQILSVPYAIYAEKTGNVDYSTLINKPFIPEQTSDLTNNSGFITGYTETDPVFGGSPAGTITNNDIENWNNKLGNEIDSSVTNELQVLSISRDTIYLSNGGFVKLPDYVTSVQIHNDSLYVAYKQEAPINEGYIGRGAPGSTFASVTIDSVSDIAYTSARIDANVTANGGEFVMSRGICLSASANPTLNNTCYASGSGTGAFDAAITGLSPNTRYYARPFASNAIGTSYGNDISFTTLPQTVPTLTTSEVYNISLTSAMSGGHITDDGGLPLLERGICWSLSPAPTIADHTDPQGTVPGNFNALMNGLASGTKYYVRAYAKNTLGTSYGNEFSFTTNALSLASITTNSVSNISYTTVTCGGTVTADNGYPVSSRGICWSTGSAPTIANSKYSEAGGVGSFTAAVMGLSPSTLYYIRAFATNQAGTVYGNEYSFTTLANTAPVLTTRTITGISSSIATSGGNITSDGGSAITAKGVCWSVNPAPTVSNNKTTDGTGSSSYNSNITGLSPLSLYYVRAYATNSVGTTYGNELSFTSTDLVYPPSSKAPIVATASSILITSSTASSGGYVSSEGGSAILARGVCWSTTTNPTLANNHTTDGTGLGYFTSTVTGITGCNTVHYIRAYAYNSTDTTYGPQNSVTTGNLPSGVTTIITKTLPDSIITGGNIPDDGGCSITQKGVCWSLTANPTTSNSTTAQGAGSGTFVSYITGLIPNVTYYIRSYATNSKGTVYGDQQVVTTAIPSSGIYLGQAYAGGSVFYIDGTKLHGLVCTSVSIGNFVWGCNGTDIATSTDFGSGETNTAAITAFCTETNTAAKACDALVLNGYSDWYLPSLNELNLVYNNIGKFGLIANIYYWSSSQCGSGYAYYSSSGYGSCGCSGGWFSTCYGGKTNSYAVLAIRKF
jgi:hypothetical protein